MSVKIINVFMEDDGWFVATSTRYGPYSREVAEKLAKGMAFAIRSSGGEARVVMGEAEDPPSASEDSP